MVSQYNYGLKKYFKKGIRILLWMLLSIIGLVLLLVVALQSPAVQRYSKNKAVAYLESKIKTKVAIEKVRIGFPKDVVLEGVYFEDQKKDKAFVEKKVFKKDGYMFLQKKQIKPKQAVPIFPSKQIGNISIDAFLQKITSKEN